jgi:hypothetical protein
VPGIIASDAKVAPVVVPPEPVTVIDALAVASPGKLAETVAVPGDTAVTSPEEFTVATAGVLEVQVTWSVMFSVLEG